MNKEHMIEGVLRLWGLEIQKIREDIQIAGSPDRCLFRTVIEDREETLYILEDLEAGFIPHKKMIAQALAFLAEKGLKEIPAYLPLGNGEHIATWQNHYWQVSPFVDGIPLDRPAYAFEGWRGRVLADFLIRLWETSEYMPFFDKSKTFSIISFNQDFLAKVESREPALFDRIRPAVDFLEQKFVDAHDDLPVRFCHGDYHPLNVIWSATGINAVIDWEFLGFKPEIYDVAMMIGCLGMEKPQSLTGDLVFEFVKRLKESGLVSESCWTFLLEFVLALRFAWLSDWLRRSDFEMIDLESVYIQLLLENRDVFKRSWGA
jgi:homoserine kinase type II